jgi:GT2 family glycosyltransferase
MLQGLYDLGLLDSYTNLESNMGLEFARQYLFDKQTYGYYFICIDNDCLPMPIVGNKDWIDRLTDLMDNYEVYAAISCRNPIMVGTGNIFEDESKDITDFPWPGGSLRIMLTSAVDEVNGWDRKSSGRGQEERFIGGKLAAAGYKLGFATHIPSLHLWGLKNTDNWGYPKDWKPEDTGHSSGVWHPVFAEGDIYEDVLAYCGEKLAKEYFL